MARKNRSKKSGLPPGTLVHIGSVPPETPVLVTVSHYSEEKLEEATYTEAQFPNITPWHPGCTTWVDVVGSHRPEIVQSIGDRFSIHPLVLEDILNATQRAKRESYEKYLFMVVRIVDYSKGENDLQSDQVSIILGDTWVITFQERKSPLFDKVRERLRNNRGRIRKEGPDYLAYAVLDTIVDNYFADLEIIGEEHEELERKVTQFEAPLGKETLTQIYRTKRVILGLRRAVWPLRELLAGIYREDVVGIRASTKVYFRDVYDHVVEIVDIVETLRETSGSLLELYLSAVNNRVNEVSKLLTMIATIFLPLTFITSIYGMNFDYMPELRSPYGYPIVIGLMAVTAIGMLVFFKKRGWW